MVFQPAGGEWHSCALEISALARAEIYRADFDLLFEFDREADAIRFVFDALRLFAARARDALEPRRRRFELASLPPVTQRARFPLTSMCANGPCEPVA